MKHLVLFIIFSLSLPLYSVGKDSSNTKAGKKVTIIDFHDSLIPNILNGKKTVTVRTRHRRHYQEGPALIRSVGDKKTYSIFIEKLRFTHYIWKKGAIDTQVLIGEGLKDPSVKGFNRLLNGLRRFYPNFKEGDEVTVVFFKYNPKK